MGMKKIFLAVLLSLASFGASAQYQWQTGSSADREKKKRLEEEKERCFDDINMACNSECPGGSMFAFEKCRDECVARRGSECDSWAVEESVPTAAGKTQSDYELVWSGDVPNVKAARQAAGSAPEGRQLPHKREAVQKEMDDCVAEKKQGMCSIASMDYMDCIGRIPDACTQVFNDRYGAYKAAEPAANTFMGGLMGGMGGISGGTGGLGGLGSTGGSSGSGGAAGTGGIGTIMNSLGGALKF
jgi:hypothetical protein